VSSRKAETETITTLFRAHGKQGMKRDKAVTLIAVSSGLPKRGVPDILAIETGTRPTMWCQYGGLTSSTFFEQEISWMKHAMF
jgi:hypothetical protein